MQGVFYSILFKTTHKITMKKLLLLFSVMMAVMFCFSAVELTVGTETAYARSFKGGRSFKSRPPAFKKKNPSSANRMQNQRGSFSRGLMGGLLGGALGSMLFGSLFGMGGQGMGFLPILLLGVAAWFIWKKMSGGKGGRPPFGGSSGFGGNGGGQWNFPGQQPPRGAQPPPPPPGHGAGTPGASGTPGISSNFAGPAAPMTAGGSTVDDGLAQIYENDRDFDPDYFKEVASDVFFQVQAGWMRRDLSSYRHLLGDQLAAEYAKHFEEMKQKGVINKLESIAIRGVDIVAAGSDAREDFVTVRFTANLLDYTVSDTSGELVEGDMNTPVKFSEEWTWARPVGTEDWRLESIE